MTTIINLTPHPITITGQGYTQSDWRLFSGDVVADRVLASPLAVQEARSLPGRIEFSLPGAEAGGNTSSLEDVEIKLCGRLGTGRWDFGAVDGQPGRYWARRAGKISIPPSVTIARAREEVARGPEIATTIPDPTGAPSDRLSYTVPTTTVSYSGTIDLPDPQPDTLYVVSVITAHAAYLAGRSYSDLLVPGEQERDERGRVVGCRSLQRWRPQWWSRRAYLDMICSQAGSAASDSSGYWPEVRKLVSDDRLQRVTSALEKVLAGLADPKFFAEDLTRGVRMFAELAEELATDPLQGYSPDEIVVGPGNQTLAQVAAK